MTTREVCHCGHDKTTHYQEQGRGPFGACLARGCDDCRCYASDVKPKPAYDVPLKMSSRSWIDLIDLSPAIPTPTPTPPYGFGYGGNMPTPAPAPAVPQYPPVAPYFVTGDHVVVMCGMYRGVKGYVTSIVAPGVYDVALDSGGRVRYRDTEIDFV